MRIAGILLILMALAPAAYSSGCEMTTTRAEIDTNTGIEGAPRHYVAFDPPCQPNCGSFFPWIYEESNGIDGLQRADEIIDDTCGGAAGAGDTIIF